MPKPIAVLISDIHYNLANLKLADAALRQAIDKANESHVPLVVAGDLHDTKANLRGECTNAMIETFKRCNSPPYILIGNHDLINEKSKEHSLNFLAPYAMIIDHPVKQHKLGYLIPYEHDPEKLREYLTIIPKGSQLIMHQGVHGANMGEYIQDKSSLPKECFKDFRVISGHYHSRQHIMCGKHKEGNVGIFSYIGTPYTTSYAEANDLPKGFQILKDDGSLEPVPTNLRKHVKLAIFFNGTDLALVDGIHREPITNEDIVWVSVEGTKEQLLNISKVKVAKYFGLKQSFRLEFIPTDTMTAAPAKRLTNDELLDSLIDSLTNTTVERKARLKETWKQLC